MKDIRENLEYREVLREIVISSQLVLVGRATADEVKALEFRLAEIVNEWVLEESSRSLIS